MYRVFEYFHRAYIVNKLQSAFSGVIIGFPIDSDIDPRSSVLPPPLYRQAGRTAGKITQHADIARGTTKISSNGEGNSRTRAPATGMPSGVSGGNIIDPDQNCDKRAAHEDGAEDNEDDD